ncbi:MAG: plasmid mobilization relaxosome protein MobC [Microbacterium sp.]|uniref:plasmid mobilization relaxosome protein MobC n=1 Tax=Microbacterium sp. TaxID=51671 RepID=UPI003F957003
MSEQEPWQRSRPVRKRVSFSDQEWETIERRMLLSDARSFEQFARTVMLEAEVVVRKVAFDAAPLRVELSRIGNNLNQIARHVNEEDRVTYEEMRAARALIVEVQQVINRAAGEQV